ncbi:MAG: V-type ATP synthase subunit D [Deltaproteobacteria bacterium]
MRINVAATKTNLFKMRKSLELTREGYDLLDEKRRILLEELTALVDAVDRFQSETDDALRKAYDELDRAVVLMGRTKVEDISFSIDTRNSLTISHRRIMGVHIPVIALEVVEKAPYFRSFDTSLAVDETIRRFRDVMRLLASLAEKKIALLRIAAEVQKTIRKVNALEKIYIPYYQEAVKYIGDRLDEESRDAFALLKLIKNRRSVNR